MPLLLETEVEMAMTIRGGLGIALCTLGHSKTVADGSRERVDPTALGVGQTWSDAPVVVTQSFTSHHFSTKNPDNGNAVSSSGLTE